jgi:hypothetical protein
MNIFVLEDNKYRIEWFKEKYDKDNNLVIVSDIDSAILELSMKDFDVLFLNDDFGKKETVYSANRSPGYQLTKFIKEKGKRYQRIVIHSNNKFSAENMYNKLKDLSLSVKKIPFTVLKNL